MSITLPLLIALRRRRCRRSFLIILTIWSQAFCHGFGNSFPNFVTGGLGRGVTFVAAIACSGFILTMLYLDRKVDIEYSVPYAVTCSLALNAAVLGASYIMAIFYRFDSWLDSAFGVSSTLVSQIALSIFGSVLLFVISIVSKRITTVRDEAIFTLPGFFAVVHCANIPHTHTHIHAHTHART
jgi:hypothetical protein